MVKTIEAVFDGTVFRPTESVALAPNTRVRVTIETVLPAEGETPSFLRTARALRLEGPPDWSANIDEYLYGGYRPMQAEVFLDTAYAIALSSTNDQFHARAVALAEQLEALGTRLVTTRAVLLEIGNALSKQRYRQAAVQLLTSLEADPKVNIVPLAESLYARAMQLYQERPDKEWGLTDCVSFLIMQDRGLTEALTTDEHFQQAGFRALLREESS